MADTWWGSAIDWLGDNIDWSDLLGAGAAIAKGYLEDENKKEDREFDRETQALNLQDKERDRANDREIEKLRNEAQLAVAKLQAATSAENTKRTILGDALLQKGKDQGNAMLESYKSSANKPERFNTAANSLAQLLARG